jgi:SAM-dependent methyltransferase
MSPRVFGKKALEIGCAPGKWIIFLEKERGYLMDGCEYLHSAVITTEKNLAMNGLSHSRVYEGDFLTCDFGEQKYDLIISLGFIEHFNDPDIVIRKMMGILKPGGFLLIGIPKLTGLNYFFAQQVDKTIKNRLLPRHNLDIMNSRFFIRISDVFVLTPIKISCIGAFEPALFDISSSPLWVKIIFYLCTIMFHNRFCRFINAEWYSSYLMAAYRKA